MTIMNIAVILAGGVGRRMENDVPKQFLIFNGKTCLEHTLYRFVDNENIDRIIVVVPRDWISFTSKLLEQSKFDKCQIVPAGDNRSQSSYNALKFIEKIPAEPRDNVLIHDAVRPFVSNQLINECIAGLKNYDAVTVAVPATDTVIEASDEIVTQIPKREKMFINQTPQAFKFQPINQAYEHAYEADPSLSGYSDDCGVFYKYSHGSPIKIVRGDYRNIKLTTPTDLKLFAELA